MPFPRVPTIAYLIEDDALDVLLMKRCLQELGVPAEHCPEMAPPAASQIDASEMLIVDLSLGSINGLDLVAQLRKDGDMRPILIATGRGDERVVIECIRAGADDYISKSDLSPEHLKRSMSSAMSQWGRRMVERERAAAVEELQAANERLDRLAMRDELTDLLNRRGFRARFESALAASHRYGHSVHLLMIDLDDFKRVNDVGGHAAGDQILTEFGALLNSRLRRDDFAGRLGGDEFVICLEHVPEVGALTVARWLIEATPMISWGADHRPLGCSIGLASAKDHEDPDSIFARADRALYGAKDEGRGRLNVAD